MTGNELMIAKLSYYDHSYNYSCSLYDNLPYKKTYELCNEHTVRMYSGNVIKFFQYELKSPFLVSNHDYEVASELEIMRLAGSTVAEGDGVVINSDAIEIHDDIPDGIPYDEHVAQLIQDSDD